MVFQSRESLFHGEEFDFRREGQDGDAFRKNGGRRSNGNSVGFGQLFPPALGEEEVFVVDEDEWRHQRGDVGAAERERKHLATSDERSGDWEPLVFPVEVSELLSALMSNGVTADQLKAISKKYPLVFSDETFSIKPLKLDGLTQRRVKDKDWLKAVNAAEESLKSTHLKIMDIAPPLILYTRVSELENGDKKNTTNDCLQAVLQQWEVGPTGHGHIST